MNSLNKISILLLSIALISGCASTPKVSHKDARLKSTNISLSDTAKVKKRLNAQLTQWKSIKYKLGGLSKRGIDCSGFVYLTFQSKFGIQLPRTTKRQAKAGKLIKQRHLKIGDLVFFKTSWRVRHVGIYMGERKFMHASTSRGVMVSRLDNIYWKKRYWKAIRVGLSKLNF